MVFRTCQSEGHSAESPRVAPRVEEPQPACLYQGQQNLAQASVHLLHCTATATQEPAATPSVRNQERIRRDVPGEGNAGSSNARASHMALPAGGSSPR